MKSRHGNAVSYDGDFLVLISCLQETLSNGVGINQNAIGQLADMFLHAAFHAAQMVPRVPDRGDDGRNPGQPGGRYAKHIRVETVGMHEIDRSLLQIPGKLRLFFQSLEAVEARDPVFSKRCAVRQDLVEKFPLEPQAGQVKLEPRRIEFPDQVQDLALRPADVKVRHELEQPDFSRIH